jgi:hypothetical protein
MDALLKTYMECKIPFLLNNNFPAIANSEGLLYSVLSKEGGVGSNLFISLLLEGHWSLFLVTRYG